MSGNVAKEQVFSVEITNCETGRVVGFHRFTAPEKLHVNGGVYLLSHYETPTLVLEDDHLHAKERSVADELDDEWEDDNNFQQEVE